VGTQKSLPTPRGGDWTPVKRDINALLNGSGNVNPDAIIAGVIGAARGLSFPSTLGVGGGGGGSSGGSGGGGGGSGSGGGGGGSGSGGGGGGGATRSSSVGRAVSGLGGFGAALVAGGLGAALDALGLGELRGKPPAEVVARIAEHMASMADGLQQEMLNATLRDAILDAAALQGDRTYEHLEASLQSFLASDGIEGLVECFLTRYVFDRVWTLVEPHIELRTASENDTVAMSSAIEGGCRSQVKTLIEDLRSEGRFDEVDWFGPAGQTLGNGIVATLEFRLNNPESQEGT
jgi:hypothetical protein